MNAAYLLIMCFAAGVLLATLVDLRRTAARIENQVDRLHELGGRLAADQRIVARVFGKQLMDEDE